ncbi:MAG TPA: hypothetical protein VF810_00200 [Patescibacteria group bacterium]
MLAKTINKLLEKEMDRKEFLLCIGLILLTVTGFTGLLKNISTITRGNSQGFGAGPYGK